MLYFLFALASLTTTSIFAQTSNHPHASVVTKQSSWQSAGEFEGKAIMRDNKTGLLWYPALKKESNWKNAIARCEALGLRLPNQDEYFDAEVHGIRKALPDLKGKSYWSSSRIDPVFTIGYNSKKGTTYYDFFFTPYSVRCVK